MLFVVARLLTPPISYFMCASSALLYSVYSCLCSLSSSLAVVTINMSIACMLHYGAASIAPSSGRVLSMPACTLYLRVFGRPPLTVASIADFVPSEPGSTYFVALIQADTYRAALHTCSFPVRGQVMPAAMLWTSCSAAALLSRKQLPVDGVYHS